ncbi:MAG: 50S ribosomal protein L11 methyltransferase [Actinomycetota bacterium]|nr:50S ribosomal protein L11 methyltransferase [Actinomycetota bacterium]
MGEISRQEARLRLAVAPDEVDVLSGELWALGTIGIQEEQSAEGVVLYAGFTSAQDADRAAGLLGRFAVLEEFGSRDYLDGWREHAEVQRAGNRIVVRPPWVGHDVEPVELVLHIEPGRSFGSGSHPSTRLALAELERVLEGNERVLDVGCGSGILAVAAARLGAVDVVGVDIDPDAPRLTHDNARRNGVADLVAASTTPLAEVGGTFDVVVANMLAPTLRELGTEMVARVRPGGRLVLAGLLVDQVDGVVDACVDLPLLTRHACEPQQGTWVAITLGTD